MLNTNQSIKQSRLIFKDFFQTVCNVLQSSIINNLKKSVYSLLWWQWLAKIGSSVLGFLDIDLDFLVHSAIFTVERFWFVPTKLQRLELIYQSLTGRGTYVVLDQ